MIASIVHPYCQKVLPLVYDDSLSYYEVLCKLRVKINECIDVINSYEETINQLLDLTDDILGMKDSISKLENSLDVLDKYTHENINLLLANDGELARQVKDLTDKVNSVIGEYDKLKQYIDYKYDVLLRKINSLTYEITSEIHVLIKGLQNQIDELAKAVAEIDTKAYNPWCRLLRKESLQRNLKYAYSDLADNVPTASEYSETGITADGYSELNLTALEYALRGNKHLHLNWVFSPVYGFRQEISNVLTSIINYFDETLSADEYAAKDMTADDYSALDIDAVTYYHWREKSNDRRVIYSPTGRGLTRKNYRHLNVGDDGKVSVSEEGHGITNEAYDRLTLDGDNNLVVGDTTEGIERAIYERLEVVEP